MVALKRGDLVWTLEQQYALVLRAVGAEVTLLMGDGRVISETADRLFPVDVHGSLLADGERPPANFRPVLHKSESRPSTTPNPP